METRISSLEGKVEQILLELKELKEIKKRKENKPHVRSATQKIPKDVDSNVYYALLELRKSIYETKHSINFAYGNDVLFDIIRNKITDAEHINQKAKVKIDEKYAKLFGDEMKKFFPEPVTEIKAEDIYIVQEENDVSEVKEVIPSKKPVDKPVDKPVYFKK